MSGNLELQLLLKLNDQMSRGLKSALQSAQRESRGLQQAIGGIATATSRIKTTPIERMTAALRNMQRAARTSFETLQKVAQTGAAVAASGYVLKSAAEKPMAFDKRLAIMSNTAYGGTLENRIAGRSKLEAAINRAVRVGGGNRNDAAETLNSLISSGAMGEGQAGIDSSMRLLPTIQRVVSQTAASSSDISSLVQAMKQQLKMSDADVEKGLAKAIVAGQQGGFDINNMAKWLPQQIALAASSGMTGMRGFETLISANQATRITAGTADEAGNNLVNLLAKITSNDTANDFKKQHVDLYGSLVHNVSKGQNPLDAFVGMVQKVGENDKQYQDLKKKADGATGPEQKALLESMASILMAKGIGKTVQDRQALTGLLGLIQQKGKYQSVLSAVRGENGQEIGLGFANVEGTSGFKVERLANEKDIAASESLKSIDGPLKHMLDGVTSVAQAHPKLAAAAYSATAALGALAAAAGVTGIFSVLKGGTRGAVAEAATRAGAGVMSRLGVSAALAGGMSLKGLLAAGGASGLATIAGGVGLAGAAGYGFGSVLNLGMNKGLSVMTGNDTSIGSLIYELLNREQANPKPIKVEIDVKNGNIIAAVNEHNARSARRH